MPWVGGVKTDDPRVARAEGERLNLVWRRVGDSPANWGLCQGRKWAVLRKHQYQPAHVAQFPRLGRQNLNLDSMQIYNYLPANGETTADRARGSCWFL